MKAGSIFPILAALTLFSGGTALGGALAVGQNQEDENGIVPVVWWKFDCDAVNYGSASPETNRCSETWVLTQGGCAITSHTDYGNGVKSAAPFEWTLCVVAKVNSTDNGAIFTLGNANSDGSKTRGIALASGGADKVTVSPFWTNAAHADLVTADVANAESAYHFYAVTMDKDKYVKLYVDGVLVNDGGTLLAPEITSDLAEGHWQFGSVYGGVRQTGLTENKSNSFDDVRFYGQTLTAEQISRIAASFPVWTGELTLEEGGKLTLEKDTHYLNIKVNANTTIDLNGHDLTIGSMTRVPSSGDNIVMITNSVDAMLSTMTAGVFGGDAQCNYLGRLGGNLKYITTGKDNVQFWGVDNYHTGGTVFSNVSLRVRSPKQFGSGDVTLTEGARVEFATTNPTSYDYGTWSQDIYVYGKGNKLNFDPQAGDSIKVTLTGKILGDGELCIGNGHHPSIYLNGDTSDFTGTLYVEYAHDGSQDWKGVYMERANNFTDGTASLVNATVVMTNKEESARNFLYIAAKENTAGTVFRIGHLVTGTEDALAYTNSELRTYKDGLTLEVGALGKDGTFAANIRQYETKTSGTKTSLVKVGDGTWTLTGTNHVYGGTTTVKGGRLNIDSAEFTAGTAIIVTNAVLGGTGTIKVPITVKEHGALAGSFTATQGATFEAGSCVEIAAEAENTPTFETDVDVANVTVKLTGELDTAQEYTILTAGSGSSGRAKVVVDKPSARGAWRTKLVAGDGGVKVLTAYFVKPGLAVIIR